MRQVDYSANRIQRVRFHEQIKMVKSQYFCIVMHIWLFLNLLVVFCVCWKLTKRHHARNGKLVIQQRLASIFNKNPKILTKRPPVANSGTNTVIGAFAYWGIPSYLWSRPEQFHHLPESLLPWWLQVADRVSKWRPHLQLYWKSTYFHYFWLYFQLMAKNVWYLMESIPLAYLRTSAECAGPINRPNHSQRVKKIKKLHFQICLM